MKSAERALAFDLGSSGGRIIAGDFDGEKLALKELVKFPHMPVEMGGTYYWDFIQIWQEAKQGLKKAAAEGPFCSIASDSWGSDMVILRKDGQMLQDIVSYRDDSLAAPLEKANALFTPEELYGMNGCYYLYSPVIAALTKLKTGFPGLLDYADALLNHCDFFNYLFSGEKCPEFTIASTTQFLDPLTKNWRPEIIRRLGLPEKIFIPPVLSGKILGTLRTSLAGELGVKGAQVIASCGHDSASALAAVPALGDGDWMCISSGSWSVLMCEDVDPAPHREGAPAEKAGGFMYEGCYGGVNRLVYNQVGMWIIQQLRREFGSPPFDDMDREAGLVPPYRSVIIPQHYKNLTSIVPSMRQYCKESGQPVPETRGELVRCAYDSISINSAVLIRKMQRITGREFARIFVAGGGVHSSLMLQSIADLTGKEVIACTEEATAAGNILVQFMALGRIGNMQEARQIAAASFKQKSFFPRTRPDWDIEKYTREMYDRMEP